MPRSAAPPVRRFDSLAQQAFLNLWRTYDRLRAEEDALFSRHGLTAQQYNALRVLRAEYPASLPTLALAQRLVSRAPDITRLLDKLQRRGLVRRDRPPDNRRLVRVGITPKGLALLDRLAQGVRDCGQRQLGHLTSQQLEQLIELLEAARQPHEDPSHPWAVQSE